MKSYFSRWAVVALGVLALGVIVWTMAGAVVADDGRLSPPEWPTQTPPPVTSEPYPPPDGYPGPYPAPGNEVYLPAEFREWGYP